MNIYSRQSWMDPRLSYDEDYPEIKVRWSDYFSMALCEGC